MLSVLLDLVLFLLEFVLEDLIQSNVLLQEYQAVLVSVNFGCFSLSRFSHFHCNAMRKAIEAP